MSRISIIVLLAAFVCGGCTSSSSEHDRLFGATAISFGIVKRLDEGKPDSAHQLALTLFNDNIQRLAEIRQADLSPEEAAMQHSFAKVVLTHLEKHRDSVIATPVTVLTGLEILQTLRKILPAAESDRIANLERYFDSKFVQERRRLRE